MISIGIDPGGINNKSAVIHRELYRGVTGGAAEPGHVIIDYNDTDSNSNTKGGIEAYLGQRFLVRNALPLIRKQPDNPLSKHFLDGFEIRYKTLGNDAALLGAGSLAFEHIAPH